MFAEDTKKLKPLLYVTGFVFLGIMGMIIKSSYFRSVPIKSTEFISDLNNDFIKEKVNTFYSGKKDTLYSKLIGSIEENSLDTIYSKHFASDYGVVDFKNKLKDLSSLNVVPDLNGDSLDDKIISFHSGEVDTLYSKVDPVSVSSVGPVSVGYVFVNSDDVGSVSSVGSVSFFMEDYIEDVSQYDSSLIEKNL